MAIIKCKMCGGDLSITEGLNIAECEYCGSMQTIPTADNEKKMTLFTRASRLLRGCEFDKAAGVFENIVAEFPEEAEAYWGLVLCKYGIEYVDDPATGKKVPTCHRSSFESVLDDVNFELACENTDAVARRLYRAEARQIEELRRAIIEVSGREDPYDLFISYKETDEHGERTLDSVIAQDIYDTFTQEAYRVFFSRISLEDKLGVEYEPYIFAALNSANVMLVVGTDYENFDSVWVKNEWSRFLKLMSQDKNKHLIPVYKNMDPYDMPKEFVKLAAQDMGKLGAMQDLVRGVKKLAGTKKTHTEEKRETVVIQQSSGGPNVRAMIDRGNMALEDNKWNDAAEFFNRALDMDAKCSEAYLGLFLIENNSVSPKAFVALILKQNEDCEVIVLEACPEDTERMQCIIEENYVLPHYQQRESIEKLFPFDRTYESSTDARNSQLVAVKAWLEQNKNLVRAFKFADGEALEILLNMQNGIISGLQSRVDKAKAEDEDNIARIKSDYAEHLDMVEAEAKRQREAAEAQCEADYVAACEYADRVNTEHLLLDAAQRFTAPKLRDYKDSAQRAEACKQRAEQIKAERIAAQEAERQRILAEKEAERQRVLAEKEAERQRKAAEKEERKRLAAEEAERKRALARERRIEAAAKAKKIVVALCVFGVLAAAGIFLIPKAIEISPSVIEKMEQAKSDGKEKTSPSTPLTNTISAGASYTYAVKTDGTVLQAGDAVFKNYSNIEALGWENIVSVSSEPYFVIGLKSDGTVVITDLYQRSNDIQDDVAEWKNIVAISSGSEHVVGLKADGTVVACATSHVLYNYGQCGVYGWTDIVAISAGTNHTVGLKSDGTVVVCGLNDAGQCDASDWSDISAISAGEKHTVGLKADGTVVAVGANAAGQCNVSEWENIVAISAGPNYTVGLKSDGTAVATGANTDGRCDVSDWTDIVSVSAGVIHTVGLKSDGTVVAVGSNKHGQCDVRSWTDIMMPTYVGEETENAAPVEIPTPTEEPASNISWELSDDGTLTIGGNGRMEDYTSNTDSKHPAPWFAEGVRENIYKVVINPGITHIGENAFALCPELREVWLPEGLLEIGNGAFHRCEYLRTVALPSTLTVIGEKAFDYCSSLVDVNLPSSLENIGMEAFGYCSSLGSIIIPEGVEHIPNHAFSKCSRLSAVVLPSTLKIIDSQAFGLTSSLRQLNIPEGVITIGMDCFWGSGISEITLPASLELISGNAFKDCKSLRSVEYMGTQEQWSKLEIYAGNEYLLEANIELAVIASGEAGENISWVLDNEGTLSFTGTGVLDAGDWKSDEYKNSIRKLIISSGITSIGNSAFAYCENLQEVVLPDTLEAIGSFAFCGTALRELALPAVLESIGASAFDSCTSLYSVELFSNIKNIDLDAFNNCISLRTVKFNGTEEQWNNISIALKNDPLRNADITFEG